MSHIAIVSDGPRNRGENHDHATGCLRYLYSTNHKDIGTMYLVFAICAGLIGGIFSIVIRTELQHPGLQIFSNTHTYKYVRDVAWPYHDLLHLDASDDGRIRQLV